MATSTDVTQIAEAPVAFDNLSFVRGMTGKATGLTPADKLTGTRRVVQAGTKALSDSSSRSAKEYHERVEQSKKDHAEWKASSWFYRQFNSEPQIIEEYQSAASDEQAQVSSRMVDELDETDNVLEFGNNEEVKSIPKSRLARIWTAVKNVFSVVGHFFKMIFTCGCFRKEAKAIGSVSSNETIAGKAHGSQVQTSPSARSES